VNSIHFIDGLWEGKADGTGHVYKFNEEEIDKTLKSFYMDYKLKEGNEGDACVVLADGMQGLIIPVEDEAPVVSVRYLPETIKHHRVYRSSELLSPWDKRVEAVKEKTLEDMNMKYEKPKTKKKKGQEADNGTPNSDSSDDDGEPKFEETVVPAKWWAQLADGHHKITQLFGRHKNQRRSRDEIVIQNTTFFVHAHHDTFPREHRLCRFGGVNTSNREKN
jgi:hypothetical protein